MRRVVESGALLMVDGALCIASIVLCKVKGHDKKNPLLYKSASGHMIASCRCCGAELSRWVPYESL